MLATFLHLLAQTPVEQAQEKTAAEEGRDIVLMMLLVGVIFVGFALLARPVELALAQAPQRASLDPARAAACMIRAAMRPELPSGTVTFLFTDVEGSTRLLHELGAEAYAEALAEHRRVIREACAAAGRGRGRHAGRRLLLRLPESAGRTRRRFRLHRDARLAARSRSASACTRGRPLLDRRGLRRRRRPLRRAVASSGHGGQVVLSQATPQLVDVELARPRRAPAQGHRRRRSRSTSSATGASLRSRRSRTRTCRVRRAPSSAGRRSSREVAARADRATVRASSR